MLLRFMTYNIKDGGLGREQVLLDMLAAVRPDVAVLQEVYAEAPLAAWAQVLGMTPVFERGNASRHHVLLSRLPVLSCQAYWSFPPRELTLIVNGGTIKSGSQFASPIQGAGSGFAVRARSGPIPHGIARLDAGAIPMLSRRS